jgi:hypothetical protein
MTVMVAGERYEVAIHDAQWLAMELTEESARRSARSMTGGLLRDDRRGKRG